MRGIGGECGKGKGERGDCQRGEHGGQYGRGGALLSVRSCVLVVQRGTSVLCGPTDGLSRVDETTAGQGVRGLQRVSVCVRSDRFRQELQHDGHGFGRFDNQPGGRNYPAVLPGTVPQNRFHQRQNPGGSRSELFRNLQRENPRPAGGFRHGRRLRRNLRQRRQETSPQSPRTPRLGPVRGRSQHASRRFALGAPQLARRRQQPTRHSRHRNER
uniref:(northern house mosquito) hypothetical protein n=1 Tax=Culex pipiens TaxID=7175 RepID=A0A8D8H772_CULPI